MAVFRFTSPVGNLAVCFFVAHLYGIEPSSVQIVGAVVVAYAVSIAAVGLPGQVSFIASIAPICIALGVPTEVLGILIAVEVIPDIFRTLGNVTGDLAATSILARGQPREDVTRQKLGRRLAELRASVGVVRFDLLDAHRRAGAGSVISLSRCA